VDWAKAQVMIRQDYTCAEVSISFISSFYQEVLPERAVKATERMGLGRQNEHKEVPLPVECQILRLKQRKKR
jgi:hypothetical protein